MCTFESFTLFRIAIQLKNFFCFSYVDSHRMASVQLSSESGGDLKKAMAKHGMKVP